MKISYETKNRILTLAAICLAGIALVITLYYTVSMAKYEFHADCSDTLYWANATVESGRIISKTFAYSALLPFGGQTVMVPMIWLFGFSMNAHVAGMAVFTLMFFAALWLLFRTLGFDTKMSATSIFVSASVFLMSAKLREIFFGHVIYYSLGILIFAVVLSLSERFFRSFATKGIKSPKTFIFGALLLIFTLLSATDGAQIIVIGILPVVFAEIFLLILEARAETKSENRAGVLSFMTIGVGTAVGTALLKILSGNVKAGYADGYSTYGTVGEIADNIMNLPKHFFTLLGYYAEGREPIFSFDSALNIIRVAVGVAIIILPIAALFLWKTNSRSTKVLLLGHIFVTAFILYGYVFGRLGAANWRMIPMVGTALLSSLAALNELFRLKNSASRFGIICLALLMLTSATALTNMKESVKGGGSSKYLYKIADYLKKHDLEYGYADYWESQALSVILGPDTRVCAIKFDSSTDEPVPYIYQTEKRWYRAQDGVERYFVLLDSADYAVFTRSDRYYELSEHLLDEYETQDFVIAVFDVNPIE